MGNTVVGVRFAPADALVFCPSDVPDPARGRRVLIRVAGELREGVVAIAPAQIIAAPALAGAPHVVGVVPEAEADESGEAGPLAPEVVFLPAADGAIGPADLRRALALAARPLPPAPEERR